MKLNFLSVVVAWCAAIGFATSYQPRQIAAEPPRASEPKTVNTIQDRLIPEVRSGFIAKVEADLTAAAKGSGEPAKKADPAPPPVFPIAKVQMPSIVVPGRMFAITTRGSIGAGRTAIFRPELPEGTAILELTDKRTNDDAFMVTLPESAKGAHVFIFVVTQPGVDHPAVEAVPFNIGPITPAPKPVDPPPKPVDPVVDPDPKPKPSGPFHVTVLDDYTKRTPASATVLTSQKIRAAAAAAGHAFRMFDGSVSADNETIKAFGPWITKAGGLPCVVIQEKNSQPPGRVVTQFALPATEDLFIEAVKKAGAQ